MRHTLLILVAVALLAGCGGQSEQEKRATALEQAKQLQRESEREDAKLQRDLDEVDKGNEAQAREADYLRVEPHLQGLCMRAASVGPVEANLYREDVEVITTVFQADPEAFRDRLVALTNEMQDCLPSVATQLDRLLNNG